MSARSESFGREDTSDQRYETTAVKKEVTNLFRIYHIFAKVLATYVRNKCAFETIVRK